MISSGFYTHVITDIDTDKISLSLYFESVALKTDPITIPLQKTGFVEKTFYNVVSAVSAVPSVLKLFQFDFEEINELITQTVNRFDYELVDELITEVPCSRWCGYGRYAIRKKLTDKEL